LKGATDAIIKFVIEKGGVQPASGHECRISRNGGTSLALRWET
jgi:hypothetical protein